MIRFSRSEDYAVILLNHLAMHFSKRLVPLSEVAKEYKISLLFLRNLANVLKKAGIITATEGKHGGYTLAKDPKDLIMGEILPLFSEKRPMLECCSVGTHHGACDKIAYCPTGKIWRKLNQEFLTRISNLTLKEFMKYDTQK